MSEQISDMPVQGEQFDVIIVGAGLAGLTAAVKILQKEASLSILILEGSNMVGGQIGVTSIGEIGGRWITHDQYHIRQLMEYLNVPLRRYQPDGPDLPRCWDIDRQCTSFLAHYEIKRYLKEIDGNVYYYRPGRHSVSTNTQSMEEHICNRLWFNNSRNFMRHVVLLFSGTQASDISYVQFMSFCYTCSGLKMLIDLWFIWPSSLYEISSKKLIEALSKKLENVKIVLLCRVTEVRQYKEYVDVIGTGEFRFRGDVVILAIPPKNLMQIEIKPSLPLQLVLPNSGGGVLVTSFLASYNEGHWRTAGYSGNFLRSNPLIIGHEYRSEIYTGIMLHTAGQESLVRAIVLHALAECFGKDMLLPLEFVQSTYELNSLAHAPLTTPFKRIIWSSSAASATIYRGCLGGAVQSGLGAALNALIALRPQTVSWQDAAEVQLFENAPKNDSSLLGLWFNTWNLYNMSYYGIITIGGVALLKYSVPKIMGMLFSSSS